VKKAAVITALVLLMSAVCVGQSLQNSDCLACHDKVSEKTFSASVHGGMSCTDCHAGITEIPHKTPLPAVDCATCHTENFCQQCHGPVELKGFGRKDLSGDPRPWTGPKDQPAQTTVQRVHDLNYRLTHGIDARSRQSDCATCHNVQEFCVECHQAGGNVNQFKFKPASHTLPGWTTLGTGSGGGLHAQEAQRDMESCVGCHDVPGQDPVCLTCHNANGQVR
jgi:hypothetical protein